MSVEELHRAQASILRSLRHATSARYSELMRPTGLESDVFKFHLRKLVQQKVVEKQPSGEYTLTASGKEFANNLSKSAPATQKQPKLSVAIIARRKLGNELQYLFQMRQRNPFYGFWGCITGPVQWGQSFEETAKYEFEKQIGLSANYKAASFHRKTDVNDITNEILEDKLFAIIEATNINGEIQNKWLGGHNAWMTLEELEKQQKYFKSSRELVTALNAKQAYSSEYAYYKNTDY